jgi:hypothetical protein
MVQAADKGATFAIAFNKMDLPEGLAEVQRGAHQVVGQTLESRLIPWRRKRDSVNMSIDVEVGIVNPKGRHEAKRRLGDFLAEATKSQQTILDYCLQFVEVNRFIEHEDSANHH